MKNGIFLGTILFALSNVVAAETTQLRFTCDANMKKAEYRDKYPDPQDYSHPLCSSDDDAPIGTYSILLDTADENNLYAEVEYVSCMKKFFSGHQTYSVKANEVKRDPRAYTLKIYNPVGESFWYHSLSRTSPAIFKDQQFFYTCEVESVEIEKPAF